MTLADVDPTALDGRLAVLLGALLLALSAGADAGGGMVLAEAAGAAETADAQYPLGPAKIEIRDGTKRSLSFRARWRAGPARLPAPADALLRIEGEGGEEDTGFVRLAAGAWRAGRGTLRYSDPLGGAGGIRSVVLRSRNRTRGGVLKLTGGGERLAHGLAAPQGSVSVALEIGATRWCAVLEAVDLDTSRAGRLRGRSRTAPAFCGCALSSTWEALSRVSFVKHACTQVGCHGSAAVAGNLDLRPAFAYRSLVGVPSTVSPEERRVEAGAVREKSLLWRKLAARTLRLGGVPGTSMPIGDPPFSADELEALALWIESGAPENSVVPGTGPLLGLCLEPPGS